MGLIRSGVVMALSTLLFLGIFTTGLFLTLDWSLEYETVQPQLISFSEGLIEDMGIHNALIQNEEMMNYACQSGESFIFPATKDINLEIPCSIISQGSDAIIQYGSEKIVEEIYYKNYECSFLQCLKDEGTPYVLISEKSQQFFHSKFILALLITIGIFALMFLALESKHSVLTITGLLMIVSSLPFRKINWMTKLLPNGTIEDLFLSFFTKSYNVFLIMIIIGIAMFLIGIAFEFLGLGIWFGKLFGLFKGKKNSDKKGEVALAEVEENKDETSKLKKEVQNLKEQLKKLTNKKE